MSSDAGIATFVSVKRVPATPSPEGETQTISTNTDTLVCYFRA